MVRLINQAANAMGSPEPITFANGMLSFRSDTLGNATHMWRNQHEMQLDYVLPVAIQTEPYKLNIPTAYLAIISACIYFEFVKNRPLLEAIPPIGVEIKYCDIGDRMHKSSFGIMMHVMVAQVQAQAVSIEGYLEPKQR